MAKGKKRNRNGGGDGWTASDHIAQAEKKERRNERISTKKQNDSSIKPTTKLRKSDRTSLLTHNTQEKRDAARLQLHITKVQREIKELKQRLTSWDPVHEAQRKKDKLRKEQELMAKEDHDDPPKKKRGRLGPESWKLRGAARPACEVYDFDTRYVDPYVKDHEQAAASAARSQNLLRRHVIADSATNNHPGSYLLHSIAPDEAREYLGLLMQLGYLCQEAKQYKTARGAFLECIELEGDDTLGAASSVTAVTSAREALMRMYLDLERYDAAYRLGERLKLDTSCVIRFTMAIVAMHLQKEEDIVAELLVQAVKSNIFATYYLSYFDIFRNAIEFTDDLAESDDEPQSTFEEALEYCSSKHATLWKQTDGALSRLKTALQSSIGIFSVSDLEWDQRLSQIESQFHDRHGADSKDDDDDNSDTSPSDGLDVPMFACMFRTAMDMAQESES